MSFQHLVSPKAALFGEPVDYAEWRYHEVRKSVLAMVDGSLTRNQSEHQLGTSARVACHGYWGFAASNQAGETVARSLGDKALANARAMKAFGDKPVLRLPSARYQGEHRFQGKPVISRQEALEWMNHLHAYCQKQFPALISTRWVLGTEQHEKYVTNSLGSEVLSCIDRAAAYVFFTAENQEGQPVELMEVISGKGTWADLDLSLPRMESLLAELHEHLMAKREAVSAKGGKHTVILHSDLTGILAHEAMGHPCEADLVLGGAVTGDLKGQRVASDLVTMVDFAHSYQGTELLVPVYADDEGTPASDVRMIENGLLTGYMHSRETASLLGSTPTGNARAYGEADEPLVRMRNTAILPGTSSLDQMVSEVDEGYLLIKSGNGEADTTTEFMFGISLGYEIKNGKIGRAIKDTTLSGSAIEVLKTVDAVSSDMRWDCAGYCGKKQPMIVSVGGPSLRAVAHLGGE